MIHSGIWDETEIRDTDLEVNCKGSSDKDLRCITGNDIGFWMQM